MTKNSCVTCKHYLGGGCCNLGEERECAECSFELWEHKEDSIKE